MAADIASMGSTQQGATFFGHEVEKAPPFVLDPSHLEHTQPEYPAGDRSLFDTTEQELMTDFFSHPDDTPRTHFMAYNSLMMGNPPFSTHRVNSSTGEFSPRITFADLAKVHYSSSADDRRLSQGSSVRNGFTLSNAYSHTNNDQVLDGASSLLDLRSAPPMLPLHHGSLDGPSSRDGVMWSNPDQNGLTYEQASIGAHDHMHHRPPSSGQLAHTDAAPAMFAANHDYGPQAPVYTQSLDTTVRPQSFDFDWSLGTSMRQYMPVMSQPATSFAHGNGRPTGLLFGADPNFGAEHYNAPHSATDEQEKASNLLHVPLADQAANNPSSGEPHERRMSGHNPHVIGGIPLRADVGSSSYYYPAWSSVRASTMAAAAEERLEPELLRKRRRTQSEREEDDEYLPEGYTLTRTPKAPIPKTEHGTGDNSEEALTINQPIFKRRKSSHNQDATASLCSPMDTSSPVAGGDGSDTKMRRKSIGKTPRQNLTDEQKRQNHIASEQKRRNVIKQGYAELERLVPGLNEGKSGLSRSDQVREIWQYVARLVQGNKDVLQALQQ